MTQCCHIAHTRLVLAGIQTSWTNTCRDPNMEVDKRCVAFHPHLLHNKLNQDAKPHDLESI